MREKKIKSPKPFYKKWWFVAIILIVIIGAIGSGGGVDEADESAKTEPTTTVATVGQVAVEATTAQATEAKDVFKDGMYKVGTDIAPGLYRAEITGVLGMGYIERSKDSSMTLDSIIANANLTGDGYVMIKDTDAFVKITGAVLSPFDIESAEKDFSDVYEDGMYIVGIDIEAGEYKVEVTDTVSKMGYVERISDASHEMNSIIANSIIQNQGYITISATDFAVRLQGVKLSK